MRILTVVIFATLSMMPRLNAEDICRKEETVSKCFDRLRASAPNEQRVRTADTGAGTHAGTSSSSIKDFLPPLAALIQSTSLDSNKQELLITWNLPRFSDGVDTQLQSIVHQPQLFSTLKTKLDAANQSSRASTLQSGLNDLDDIEIIASAGLNQKNGTNRLGRHFDTYRDVFEEIFPPAQAAAPSDELHNRLLKESNALLKRIDPTAHELKVSDIPDPSDRRNIENLIAKLASQTAFEDQVNVWFLKENDLAFFSDLVANQPQLTCSFTYRSRSAFTGPSEATGEVSWEHSGTNINRYLEEQSPPSLASWKAFVKDAKPQIKAAGHWKVSFKYTWIDRYSVNVQPENVAVSLPQGRRVTGSVTYGRALLFDKNDAAIGRIDALAEYDNYSDDPKTKDRFVVSLTYTQKFSDSFSLPLGIAYANHADFLGDVQERFSAHFGLKLKVDWKAAASSGK